MRRVPPGARRPYPPRGRNRRNRPNPRRTGGLLLAVGTILALFGLSAVDQQTPSAGHLGADHVAVAAHDAPVLLHLPVDVPQGHAADEFAVAPDELSGPKPAAPLSFSVPVHITVPQVGLNADVTPVGLVGVGHAASSAVPLKGPQLASWYDLSPAPGQLGVSVFGAHVKGRTSAVVRPGDTVTVTRADHSVAIFTVDKTELVPAWRMRSASQQVTDATPYPALNLETCTGPADSWRHGCRDHTIVHAHLTAHRAQATHSVHKR
ncbi:sortase domain-containing protein [Actinospica robiniae]|uniref:sortase domain-containing protein n=1 Tax=Actinospica robiniae TaxID=304901 RepID=UPI000412F075|nr:class F sortase [Actinospica robiniae]